MPEVMNIKYNVFFFLQRATNKNETEKKGTTSNAKDVNIEMMGMGMAKALIRIYRPVLIWCAIIQILRFICNAVRHWWW